MKKVILITGIVFVFLMIGFCTFNTIRESPDEHYISSSELEKAQTPYININTAEKEELMILPGITESTANEIIRYREENGAFQDTEDIIKVKGVSKKKYQYIKLYITV